jgi:hypothetical protein
MRRIRCSGHAPRPAGAPDRERSEAPTACAHPFELTAVSAIFLDLLSGFQRPSHRRWTRGPGTGGPTLLRSDLHRVKRPTWTALGWVSPEEEPDRPATNQQPERVRSRGGSGTAGAAGCQGDRAQPPRGVDSPRPLKSTRPRRHRSAETTASSSA